MSDKDLAFLTEFSLRETISGEIRQEIFERVGGLVNQNGRYKSESMERLHAMTAFLEEEEEDLQKKVDSFEKLLVETHRSLRHCCNFLEGRPLNESVDILSFLRRLMSKLEGTVINIQREPKNGKS